MMILATVLILMPVIVKSTTNGSGTACIPLVRVPRNTVFLAPVTSELKINCSITLHGCHRNPRVSWCKIYGHNCNPLNYSDNIRTEWKNLTEHEGMAFLVFSDISMEDTGLYRCKEGDMSISHAMNVTVTLADLNTQLNNWYFLYISSGILGLVFIVIIVSFLYAIRHQGRKSTRKHMANKNQCMETQKGLPPALCLNSDVLTSVLYRA
ncbi:uncharacterized protein LOC122334823 isoform X2 [Puntigrus tetrazona]|uniref:uncharacterized protein LOC122334823 isoform X2 n=1 Tax=Puntigrus tetrazona TaxID=1606681 RepID=UPI001C8A45A9|nr:uncharacterized protein LOC122334823 isoform X2 [Puntigrus tetrazona]